MNNPRSITIPKIQKDHKAPIKLKKIPLKRPRTSRIIIALILLFLLITPKIGPLLFLLCLIFCLIVFAHSLIKIFTALTPKTPPKFRLSNYYQPFVSIHLACKDEPYEVVNRTLRNLSHLEYPSFEVLVSHNNNLDAENWHQIERCCYALGKKFRFYHFDRLKGYKSGALNQILELMDPRTEIVAIIDSDYDVSPEFLKDTVGYFQNPNVGIVQAPQDYRNVKDVNIGLYLEYRSFFANVINQAQKFDAVTFTGTMGLIRAKILKQSLSWNEWCITEDTAMGIHVNSIGYKGVFVDKSLGKGLMPFDYRSLRKQRQRWVFGNMQIIGRYLPAVFKNHSLKWYQKFSFISQLVTWIHFELVIAIVYFFLSLRQIIGFSALPTAIANQMILATLTACIVGNLLYFFVGLRNEASLKYRFEAFLAHYGLIEVMSTSWLRYFIKNSLAFNVTSKTPSTLKTPISSYFQEMLIPITLSSGLTLRIIFKESSLLGLIIIPTFIIFEVAGIFYLGRSFKKTLKEV